MMPGFMEMFVTTYLTALAASSIGLLLSALFTNPDRALTVAPLPILVQILFSGLIFDLSGVTDVLSWIVVCRWSMEGYGTTANLNQFIRMGENKSYEYTSGHMMLVWFIIILIIAGSLFIAQRALSSLSTDNKS